MTKKPDQKTQAWIDARKCHRLSHAQVQVAQEFGTNSTKLDKLDNYKQESWKLPLPEFIKELYFKRFGKLAPDTLLSIEERLYSSTRRRKPCVRPSSRSR